MGSLEMSGSRTRMLALSWETYPRREKETSELGWKSSARYTRSYAITARERLIASVARLHNADEACGRPRSKDFRIAGA